MRRILAVVVLALSALVGLPATSHAGGPTSVLVTHVGVGAGGLYYSDEAYDALVRLLPEGATAGEAEPPGYDGASYNLTWMIHDVLPWRWDRIHVDGDGTAWVSTTVTEDAAGEWRELGQADRLVALLDRVVQRGGGPAVVSVPAESTEPAAAASEPADPAGPASDPWFSLSGWRWLVPGVLLGLLVGAVGAHRRGESEQRQVLVTSDA